MRRYFLALSIFVFGLIVVGVSIWRSRTPLVTLAVESTPSVQEVVGEVSEEVMIEAEDDYPLPYSGILPDHPLYFLKMIRDRVMLWLTRDSLARAGVLLHYADKRIAAALALAEKGKAGLAVTTATKAEKYLERTLDEAGRAAEDGKDVVDFSEKASRASVKHKKVLVGILSLVPEEAKSAVEQALDTNGQVYEQFVQMAGLQAEPVSDVEVEEGEEVEGVVEIEEEGAMEEE
jgi:hypothetical protein